jgi:hypothetical protein
MISISALIRICSGFYSSRSELLILRVEKPGRFRPPDVVF